MNLSRKMDPWARDVREADVAVAEGFEASSFLNKATELEPDREALSRFASIMFKHARRNGFVSLRLFPDKGSHREKAIDIEPIRVGDKDFLDVVVTRATQAANWPTPAVFCPPVATFKDHQNAKADNICEGVALSVECDQLPHQARQTLEAILGQPTVIVESGGEW